MRELEAMGWRCARCGADACLERAEADGGEPSRTLAARAGAALFAGEARERSGLAYAAGFAGLAYLFWPSLALLAADWVSLPWANLALLWRVLAPVALVLGLSAGYELDHAPEKVGRVRAFTGFLLGLCGTLSLV